MAKEAELGCPVDTLTGYPIKLDQRDAPVEMLPHMIFWLRLDEDLVGARNENGFVVPSELFAALDRWGIKDEDNRETAKLMLDCIAMGRNKAMNEDIKRPKQSGDDPNKPPTKGK